jgi:hypothetical protein
MSTTCGTSSAKTRPTTISARLNEDNLNARWRRYSYDIPLPPAHQMLEYAANYCPGFKYIGMTRNSSPLMRATRRHLPHCPAALEGRKY